MCCGREGIMLPSSHVSAMLMLHVQRSLPSKLARKWAIAFTIQAHCLRGEICSKQLLPAACPA